MLERADRALEEDRNGPACLPGVRVTMTLFHRVMRFPQLEECVPDMLHPCPRLPCSPLQSYSTLNNAHRSFRRCRFGFQKSHSSEAQNVSPPSSAPVTLLAKEMNKDTAPVQLTTRLALIHPTHLS